jgi:hydroxypyruvate isomerase
MPSPGDIGRRELLKRASAAAVAAAAVPSARPAGEPEDVAQRPPAHLATGLNQSVCRWCFEKIPLPDFCRAVAGMGLTAIDLLTPDQWPVAAEYGLSCSMGSGMGGPITRGLNDPANHDTIVSSLTAGIPRAALSKVPNVITFFGNRQGRSDAEAIRNCVAALNRVKAVAEDNGVTICIELLNSKVDHADYQGDRTAFGVAVCSEVNSPRVKLLYDIYHVQVMEGDVIRTIRDNHQWIAHYHTAGVPGRHEIDDTQELNYKAIARAIADTGFTGWFAHEFIPVRDPLTSLGQAVELCRTATVDAPTAWRSLFNGTSLAGWRGLSSGTPPAGWVARDGALHREGPGGDILTADQFGSFELRLEWRISGGGNSGIMFRVVTDRKTTYETGPELQVLDNSRHEDNKDPLTVAGACYGLYPPVRDATRPVGEWNEVVIIARGPHVEYWLNGVQVVRYEIGSADWEARVKASKFGAMPGFGRARRGHIALQDHGDPVWYRNIRIREI